VIVGRDPAFLPFRIAIGLIRKGGERRPIERLKQLPPALAELAHDAAVEIGDAFTDRGVEFFEGEEATIAQTCQHPSLDDQNGDFNLRLIATICYLSQVLARYVLLRVGDAGMVYIVRAIHVDGVTGTFTVKKDTLREAKEAQSASVSKACG
jgi:hypothetical protein